MPGVQIPMANLVQATSPIRVHLCALLNLQVSTYLRMYWYIYIGISSLIAYNANYSFVKRRECIFVVWYQVHTFSSNHNVYFVKIYDLNGLQPKNKGHTQTFMNIVI